MPQRIGHYNIIRKLGEGGIGTVYLGDDTRLHRLAAIKTLRADRLPDAETLRRFQQEALAASSLNHPHLMVIYEFSKDGDLHYIACEYIEGETLRHTLKGGPLPVGRALDIAIQMGRALSAAHGKGIVHRDLKPENVMVRPDGYIKVLDFGLAKLTRAPDRQTAGEGETVLITNPGALSGTPEYMSPEQADGSEVDTRSDLFSTGTMLYEMVTGVKPFHGRNVTSTLLAIVGKDPAPISTLLPDAPLSLEEVIGKALRKHREERYQTAQELVADLTAVMDELTVETRLGTRKTEGGIVSPSRVGMAGINTPSAQTPRQTVPSVTAVEPTGKSRRAWLWPAVALAGGLAVGAGYWLSPKSTVKRWDSIAVLPFANVGGDQDKAYLSQGLSDSLIASLSRLHGVRVLARSTVAAFKGDVSPTRIGDALKVASVLTGRVTQTQDTISVDVELADTGTGSLIWGDTYRRRMSDLYSVDQEIARDIIDRLRLELTADDRAALANHGTPDAEVYQLYLKGHYQLETVSAEGRRQAVEYFRKAIQKDPAYAPAYAGLGEAYATLAFVVPPGDVMPQARSALLKAIELDEKLAGAHANLAFVLDRFDWDWTAAEKEYRRAIQIDPRAGQPHSLFATFLMRQRRYSEATGEARTSMSAEPGVLLNVVNLGWNYYFNGQYDTSIATLRQGLALSPDSAWAHHLLGCAYAQKAMYREALDAAQKATAVSQDPTYVSGLARILAVSGRAGEARKIVGELVETSKTRYVPPFLVAWTYCALGDRDKTFAYLRKAVEDRDPDLPYVRIEPLFAPIRSDPAYAAILRQLNLRP